LVLCPIHYFAPSNKTVDNSWYNYAADHHLVIGRDVAWTWGPVSYLFFPFDVGRNLAKGLLFQTVFWILLILMLWDLFFLGGRLANLALFSVLVSLYNYHEAQWPHNVLLCAALIFLAHFRLRGGIIRYVAALTIMGLMPLVQLADWSVVASVILGLVVDLLGACLGIGFS
jgi:hypothetical protein